MFTIYRIVIVVWCDLGLIVNAIPRPKKIPVVPVSRPTLFFSANPIIFFNTIDRATLFSPGGCGLLVQRAKMASVVTIIIEPDCLNSSVGTRNL